MKTAISIPDGIFEAAEQMAEKLAISRSEFYARAVEQYLKEVSPAEITRQINEVCKDIDTSLDPVLREISRRSIGAEEW